VNLGRYASLTKRLRRLLAILAQLVTQDDVAPGPAWRDLCPGPSLTNINLNGPSSPLPFVG
jgi:hypothetical protein